MRQVPIDDATLDAIEKVLDYNIAEECTDYEDNGCPTGHVYEYLRLIDAWYTSVVRSGDVTADVARMNLLFRPCVDVKAHGSTELCTVKQWAQGWVQDENIALEIAASMLDGNDPYEANIDQPEFYTEYTITDREAFEAQVKAMQEEDQ